MAAIKLFDSIETELVSYWLGFFVADGHVYKSGKQCSILLSQNDLDHLEKFSQFVGKPVHKREYWGTRGKCPKLMKSCRVILSSKYLCDRMNSIGLFHNKTISLTGEVLRHVPRSMMGHFFRGYFDGDGCVRQYSQNQFRAGVCGTRKFLESLNEVVSEQCGARLGYLCDKKGVSTITWGGVDRLNLIKSWMYTEATVYLERKRRIFDLMPKHRGTSKYPGVSWDNQRQKWKARAKVLGRRGKPVIGAFKTEDEAFAAICAAKEVFDTATPSVMAEFARG